MTKVVLNMQHKTNGIKREFVEDTFLNMFYKIHNLDYITDEFLQLELEEYWFKKPITLIQIFMSTLKIYQMNN